jgi:hypothetical protein
MNEHTNHLEMSLIYTHIRKLNYFLPRGDSICVSLPRGDSSGVVVGGVLYPTPYWGVCRGSELFGMESLDL